MNSKVITSGMYMGIFAVLLVFVLIVKFIVRGNRFRTEYDEMQRQIRGTGYKYGFYAIVIYEAFLLMYSMKRELPAEPYVVQFSVIFIGILVQVSYCIIKGAYIGLNTNMKSFGISMVLVSAINLWTAIEAWREGTLISGGRWQAQSINLMCGLLFAAVGILTLIRWLLDREVDS